MDTRMIALINRLGKDIVNLENTLKRTREILKKLAQEALENGKALDHELASPPKTLAKRFLANGQPRRDGTYPQRDWRFYRENDDAD